MQLKGFMRRCNLGFCSDNYLRNQNVRCMDKLESCENKLCWAKQNKYHFIAYMPVLGAIIGLFFRIIPAMKAMKDMPPNFKTGIQFQIFRGTCETLGLGLLFLIPDIIVTIGRLCSGKWFQKPSPLSHT